jgi:hypothetical protein
MLDLSQYSNDRKQRDLEMIPFWEENGADGLRQAGLVFDLNTLLGSPLEESKYEG